MNKFRLIVVVFLTSNMMHSMAQEIEYPDNAWKYIERHETMGWNIERLIELEQFVINKTNITGLMVIYKGKILYDFGDTKELSYIASCRKSVLSMLYGKYIEEGIIDLNKTLEELEIEDYKVLLEKEKKSKLEYLLTARSGVFLPSTESGTNRNAPERGSKEPGNYFLYNNWDFNVAGFIFEKETGKNIYDALGKDLAVPIQMEDWDRSIQKKEIIGDILLSKFPEYHMWLSTRDMARLGYLMLRKGKWNGKQIIPETWVDKSTELVTSVEELKISDPGIQNRSWWKWGYGYMWRIWDSSQEIRPELIDAYSATGSYGQYITIIPSTDLVLAVKTKSEYRRDTNYETYMHLINILLDARMDIKTESELLEDHGIKADGQVVSIMWRTQINYFKFRFNVGGKDYFGWSSSSENLMGNHKYSVTYYQENPNINRIALKPKIK